MFEWLCVDGGQDDDELTRVSLMCFIWDVRRQRPFSFVRRLVGEKIDDGRLFASARRALLLLVATTPPLFALVRPSALARTDTSRLCLYLQDSERNTILHLLASLPLEGFTPAHRFAAFESGCAIRMASVYHDRCGSCSSMAACATLTGGSSLFRL